MDFKGWKALEWGCEKEAFSKSELERRLVPSSANALLKKTGPGLNMGGIS